MLVELEFAIPQCQRTWDPGGCMVRLSKNHAAAHFAPVEAPLARGASGVRSRQVARTLKRLPSALDFELEAGGQRVGGGTLPLRFEDFTGDLRDLPSSWLPPRLLVAGPPSSLKTELIDMMAASLCRTVPHLSQAGKDGVREIDLRALDRGWGLSAPPHCILIEAGEAVSAATAALQRIAGDAHAVCLCLRGSAASEDAVIEPLGTAQAFIRPALDVIRRIGLPTLVVITDDSEEGLVDPDAALVAREVVADALSIPVEEVLFVPGVSRFETERAKHFESDRAAFCTLLQLAGAAQEHRLRRPDHFALDALHLRSFDALRVVFLIDHENNKAASLSLLDGPNAGDAARALLFFWRDDPNEERLRALEDPERSARPDLVPVRAASGQRNAADFALTFWAAALHAALPVCIPFYIVSADNAVLDVSHHLASWLGGSRSVRRLPGVRTDLRPLLLEAVGDDDLRKTALAALARRAEERLRAERPRRASAALRTIANTVMRAWEREWYGSPEVLIPHLAALGVELALEPTGAEDWVVYRSHLPSRMAARRSRYPLLGDLAILWLDRGDLLTQSALLMRILGRLTMDELSRVAAINSLFRDLCRPLASASALLPAPRGATPVDFDMSPHVSLFGRVCRIECRVDGLKLGIAMYNVVCGRERKFSCGFKGPSGSLHRRALGPNEALVGIEARWQPREGEAVLVGVGFIFAVKDSQSSEVEWSIESETAMKGSTTTSPVSSVLRAPQGSEVVGIRGRVSACDGCIVDLKIVTRAVVSEAFQAAVKASSTGAKHPIPAPSPTCTHILASLDSATKALCSLLKVPQEKLQTPPVLTDRTGRLGYSSIGEAVQAAAPGQVVIVQPGRYCEQLVLDRDVYVVGTRDAVLEWTEDVTVDCIASARPTLRGVTIRGASTNDPAVFIGRGSRAVIEDCCITTAAMSCIEVRDQDTAPTIRSNIIRDSPCNGVFVHSGAAGTIEDNDISGCRAAAVLVQGRGTAPTFRSNRIHDNRECGVWIGKHAAGEFVANEIYSNRKAALGVLLHADPLVRGNRVRDQELGMVVFNGGRGTLVENAFDRIGDPSYAAPGVRGIKVLDGCSPIIQGSSFHY
eukprot:tig00021036_g17298.t1